MRTLLLLLISTVAGLFAQDAKVVDARPKLLTDAVVSAGCGLCVFEMKDESDCRLAIDLGGRSYIVEGSHIDDHGNAHGNAGLCNVERLARVSGTFEGDKFVATSFRLLPQKNVAKKRERVMKDLNDQRTVSPSGFDISVLSSERIAELAKKLSPEERAILLEQGTERAFCGGLLDNKEAGTYACRLCQLPLFASDAKFKSGTGWPSFFQPIDSAHIHTVRDESHGTIRVEIQCVRCRSHLGHVFPDGPPPTGQRYCLNSAALDFSKRTMSESTPSVNAGTETAYFAGGCFWGVEDRFQQVPGVIDAVSGYMGGKTKNPTYKDVCSGTTEHAEAVRVVYDPKKVTYNELLKQFFKFHDPTQLNRQGPDRGTQYRSAIFAADKEQLISARQFVETLQESAEFRGRRIVTQVNPEATFYEAEEYHQDYHAKHGGSCALPSGE